MKRDIPVIILEHKSNKFLFNRLSSLGFTNIILVKDRCSVNVGPLNVTVLEPFDGHNFLDVVVGNLIDSAIIIDDGEFRVLNCNDNIPSKSSAKSIAEEFGAFDLVQVQYCAAGPFPSCFSNLGDEGKKNACLEVQQRYLDLFYNIIEAISPKYAMPFAGDFVIGGSLWKKNYVLGTLSPDMAADYLIKNSSKSTPILLNEGMSFNLQTAAIEGGDYKKINQNEAMNYIEENLSSLLYPYQSIDYNKEQLIYNLIIKLPKAYDNFHIWQKKLEYYENINIYIELGNQNYFYFNPKLEICKIFTSEHIIEKPYIICSMDLRLLQMIVDRKSHWNNAEGGCHIDYFRSPDVYSPDLHTMLSFLHIPK